ncbi:MAG: hypothetical protein HOV79_32835 [Hamadaea sp.]|nr:hypothetical protein [Hamadaea sp.]
MSVEEHGAALKALARREHEEFMAMLRGWQEEDEAEGHEAQARFNRELIARLDAIPKPWDKPQATAA